MPLSEILLITIILLFVAMIAGSACKHTAIPYTVLLVILGLIINLVAPLFSEFISLAEFTLTHELVLYIFLPALIFEAALSIDARGLIKNIIPILVLAIPGMVVSMILVGLGLWMSVEVSLITALLFGALISATDPVAVVALFKELGAPRRLMLLVEGESLFNDATALVLFNILLGFLVTDNFSLDTVVYIIPEFFRVFFGGVVIGGVVGLIGSELMVRLHEENNSVPVVLSLSLAYFSYIVADHVFAVSGVMSVLTTAICVNIAGLMRLSHETTHSVHNTWDVIVLICNSLLFILIGFSVDMVQLLSYWQPVLFAVVAVTLARAVSVYAFVPLATRCFSLPRVSYGEQHIMWWGGLKGGLAIAIVLSIPDQIVEKQFLIELTVGVVLISLLLNATTIRFLIHWLKIDRLSNTEWAELQQNRERVKSSVDQILHNFTSMRLLDNQMQNSVEGAFDNNLKTIKLDLTPKQRQEQVHLIALHAEMTELNFLHDIGMINYYTLINFKDLLKKDGEGFVDFDSKEINRNIVSHKTMKKIKKNHLINLELSLMRFLSLHNWSMGLLVDYQEIRFSNRILHDIAGILMAYEALKVIKENELLLGEDSLTAIKEIYQNRLRRRQIRLNHFKTTYPDFYQQYEYFLFQKISLNYSLRLINEEFEEQKISAKVYHQLKDCLQLGLKQLPKMKAVLRLNKADDWIKKVPLFEGLPEQSLKQLAHSSQYLHFLSGDTIFNENDYGDAIYILVNGTLNVFKLNQDGVSEHLAELREGSFVGKHALLKGAKRTATIRAKTYVTLLRVTSAEIHQLSKILPELQVRLDSAAAAMN